MWTPLLGFRKFTNDKLKKSLNSVKTEFSEMIKMKISQVKNVKNKGKKLLVRQAHLKNVLGSLGGNGCGSGLLLLNSTSWTGELGMGSKRVGCPLPTPLDSRALRLGTLTNLFVGDLSFFFFCCVKNNTCENTHLRHKNQQDNRK